MIQRIYALTILLVMCLATTLKAGAIFGPWLKHVIDDDAPFSQEELLTIQKGDIVSRAKDVEYLDKSTIILFRVYGTINLPIEECWKRMRNLNAFYQTQPLMLEVSQVKAAGCDIWLRHVLKIIGLKYHYVLHYQLLEKDHTITYVLDKSYPYNIVDHCGFWRLRAWGDDRTLLEQGTYMELGFKFRPPTWLFKQISLHDLPKTIRQARGYLTPGYQ
jgi:hypothetical protein